METYVCPVCGYDGLQGPPRKFLICPCCRTEFDNDDADYSHDELRAAWLAAGAPWGSKHIPPPPGWDARRQLQAAGLSG